MHEESSMLSAKLQWDLRNDGTNYVIDTVLKSQASAREVAASLDRRGYTYDVVSVQATFEESKAGIYGRWLEGRAAFERGESQVGGRPMPSDFANNLITPGGKLATEESAKGLSERGEGVVSFRQYRRGSATPEIDQVKHDGKLIARCAATARQIFPTAHEVPKTEPSWGRSRNRDRRLTAHPPRPPICAVGELRYRSLWLVGGRSLGSCCPRGCRKSSAAGGLLLCTGGQEATRVTRNKEEGRHSP